MSPLHSVLIETFKTHFHSLKMRLLTFVGLLTILLSISNAKVIQKRQFGFSSSGKPNLNGLGPCVAESEGFISVNAIPSGFGGSQSSQPPQIKEWKPSTLSW